MKNNINNKVKELTVKLDEGVEEILTSDRFKEYLNQMSKFHNYSFSNSLLIGFQNPNATLVAGYKTWQNKFNRNVNKGEKAINILAPCPYKVKKDVEYINKETGKKEIKTEEVVYPRFKVVSVFDVSQTSGEPLKEIAIELQGECKNFEKLFKAIKECSEFDVQFESGIEEKGYCSAKNRKIVIKENMSQNQTIKTLIHEIAHEKLHFTEESKKDSSNKKEIEAESIAYVVSNYYGIDTSSYSFDYISSWQNKSKSDVKNSLSTIQETSNLLIEKIRSNLMLDKELSIEEKIKGAKSKSEKINNKKIDKKEKDKNISL